MNSTGVMCGKRRKVKKNCQDCDEDDNMEMVQCDVCDKWFHFRCVGVGPDVANIMWICYNCKQEDMWKQNPVTVSEKVKDLEKKYEVAFGDLADLKAELQLTKAQVVHAMDEKAKLVKEQHEFRLASTQELNDIKTEILELEKKFELNRGIGGSADETLLPRKIFQKLPCDTIPELDELKKSLSQDLNTLIYMEERFGSIGGSDPRSCLTSIINRLFTKRLQADMTLTGKRTEKRIILMDYAVIYDMMNNAVRKTHASYKDKDGEPLITKILSNI